MPSSLLGILDLREATADAQPCREAGEPADRAARIVANVFRCADLLRRLLTSDSFRSGTNSTRFAALRIIGDASPAGCSQSELASRLEQSESSVSGLVSRMRADGLLYRLRSKHDQRKRVLLLSESGRRLLARCEALHRRRIGMVLKKLDRDLLHRLTEPLDRFARELTQLQQVVQRGETTGNGAPASRPSLLDDEPEQLSA